MNSRERFMAALKGEKPDRTPTAHVSALTTLELQEQTGCRMPEAHHDPEQLARLSAANHDILGFDGVSFIINFFNEPAALGCEMDWGAPNRLPMYLTHPWQEPEDAVIPEDLLDRPPVSTYLKMLRIAKRDYGDQMAVIGKIMGPFSMTQVMHSLDKVMMALIDEPEKIVHFIDVAADALVKCANAQFEAGADAIAIGEGGAGRNMLSPAMHERFLMSVHQRMMKQIHGPTIMHICGDITPRLEMLKRAGLTCFNFDWDIEPKIMKQASAGAFTIMGNINTTTLLRGTPEEVAEQAKKCLEAGVDIVSPGCAVSPECPNANFQAMTERVKSKEA